MIYIYCEEEINQRRLSYVLNHILKASWGVDYVITTDESLYLNQEENPCINYSSRPLGKGIRIIPHGLLSQSGLQEYFPSDISQWQGVFTFFQNEEGDIPFDLFSATFYLITSYEEYIHPDNKGERTRNQDKHKRFSHEYSLLYKNNTLEVPVIDRWSDLLRQEIQKRYKISTFQKREFRMINTYDIDAPYLYRNKGLVRTTGLVAKDILSGRFCEAKNRMEAVTGIKKDPYLEALRYIILTQKEWDKDYLIFILAGGNTEYDRSRPVKVKEYSEQLRYFSAEKNLTLGIHPSYNGQPFYNKGSASLLKNEIETLRSWLNVPKIEHNRFHYLRLAMPYSFSNLLEEGIKHDYTLCFSGVPGFRSGTSIPYPYYDVRNDKEYPELMLHPTIMMDSTLILNQKLSPEIALEKIKHLINQAKQSGGDFVSLWHNSNLSDYPTENPWKEVYSESLHYGYSLENN